MNNDGATITHARQSPRAQSKGGHKNNQRRLQNIKNSLEDAKFIDEVVIRANRIVFMRKIYYEKDLTKNYQSIKLSYFHSRGR